MIPGKEIPTFEQMITHRTNERSARIFLEEVHNVELMRLDHNFDSAETPEDKIKKRDLKKKIFSRECELMIRTTVSTNELVLAKMQHVLLEDKTNETMYQLVETQKVRLAVVKLLDQVQKHENIDQESVDPWVRKVALKVLDYKRKKIRDRAKDKTIELDNQKELLTKALPDV